jgi:hypothetical protein
MSVATSATGIPEDPDHAKALVAQRRHTQDAQATPEPNPPRHPPFVIAGHLT